MTLYLGWVLNLVSAVITIAAVRGDTWDKEKKRPTIEGAIVIGAALVLMIGSAWQSDQDARTAKASNDAIKSKLDSAISNNEAMKSQLAKANDTLEDLRSFGVVSEKTLTEQGLKNSKHLGAVCNAVAAFTRKDLEQTKQELEQQIAVEKQQDGDQMEQRLSSLMDTIHKDTMAQVSSAALDIKGKLDKVPTSDDLERLKQSLDVLKVDRDTVQALLRKVEGIAATAATSTQCPPTTTTQSSATSEGASAPGVLASSKPGPAQSQSTTEAVSTQPQTRPSAQ